MPAHCTAAPVSLPSIMHVNNLGGIALPQAIKEFAQFVLVIAFSHACSLHCST